MSSLASTDPPHVPVWDQTNNLCAVISCTKGLGPLGQLPAQVPLSFSNPDGDH